MNKNVIDFIGRQDLRLGKLRIKVGFDPTSPDLHLGHVVLLNKAKQLQEMGHKIIFLIGDFTATIGDPTGKNISRQPLTTQQVKENCETYLDQVDKILDLEFTEVYRNSIWLDKLSPTDFIKLMSTFTVARLLERDDFKKRFTDNIPIGLHEFMYPLLQGYDSVVLHSDIELGGSDQTFNMMVGRELQKHYGQHPQAIMTMPILEGLDGVQKMSKSLNNYIGISDSPVNMFGKIMSISDTLLWRYLKLLTDKTNGEILKLQQSSDLNPRDLKMDLGKELVTRFHDKNAAEFAYQDFIQKFSQRTVPDNLETRLIKIEVNEIKLIEILRLLNLASSNSEAIRAIKQNAVKIDGLKVDDPSVCIKSGETVIIQYGKRFFHKIEVQ